MVQCRKRLRSSQKPTFTVLAVRRRGDRRVRANECGSTTLGCRSRPRDILCARTTVFSSAGKSQAHPLALLVIRRGFGCVALSFAQRNLLVLPSLFFLGPCACCPLSFSPVSTVIWLECHWILYAAG